MDVWITIRREKEFGGRGLEFSEWQDLEQLNVPAVSGGRAGLPQQHLSTGL